ncbi:uncharacterized protein JCM6883_004903 [Sporobolomyces salmoneus]|uniref:uncharacterized protein n=1 Tax=Sporobolomyces salmoneus TaxID=183962 RepID=UPI00316FFA0A
MDEQSGIDPGVQTENDSRPNLDSSDSLDSATGSASTPTTTNDSTAPVDDKNLPPLAPIAKPPQSPLSESTAALTPRTKQRQLHFADTPLAHKYDPEASTSRLPPSVESLNSSPLPSSSRPTALGLYSSSTPPTPHQELPKPTLPQTVQDLRTLLNSFLVIVPSRLRKLSSLIPSAVRDVARVLIHQVAMLLHARGRLASTALYDIVAALWRGVINIFFREIRSRGAWKIPRKSEGATIFVVGPHHNQFLDPLLLMSEVKRESGRRISFLTAAKSMERAFVGLASRLMQSIPVARAQDSAYNGVGTISLSENDSTIILGNGTTFVKDFSQPRWQIMLPRSLNSVSVEVVEVISDTEMRIKKEFPKKATESLRAKPEGTSYKVLPHVDQTSMYSSVYKALTQGGSIGIFPEGGSHDRTDLLPLKAGVSIMALGAVSAHPDLRLQIVPVGLSYFHAHKFRSRAVVEFGTPFEIPKEMVGQFEKGGEEKRKAIGDLMDIIVDGLKSVTVRAPDYDTLMLIQAARRLYRPPGQHLTLGQIVELNKRFIVGYEVYKDEPRVKELERKVKEYNTLLRYMGLKDHQIERVGRPRWRGFFLIWYRLGLLGAWGTLALPGVILNAPIFIAAKIISHKKAKEALAGSSVKIKGNDVLATWKVLVALGGAPTLYTVYAINAVVLAHKLGLPFKYKLWAPLATFAGLPVIGVAALKFGEVGMDVYKSLRPLILSLVPGKEPQLQKLRLLREHLQGELNELVEELAPAIFEDFQRQRIVAPSARPAPPSRSTNEPTDKRSTYGPAGQGTFLTHPLGWLDEYLFGWSQSMAPPREKSAVSDADALTDGQTASGYVSGYTTEEAPDYDEVIHILNREQGITDSPTMPPAPQLYRRNSRSRSRSQLDLTALDPTKASSTAVSGAGSSATRRTGAAATSEKEEQ